MLTETLQTLFTRDLNKLKTEIESYQQEKNIWIIEKGIANSGGNLCLHVIGNLNSYIGAVIGKTNYIRQRDLEFSLKNIQKAALVASIEETILVVTNSLGNISPEQLNEEYPLLVFDKKTSTGYFLVHLAAHLAYHLGQVNYHRRLLDA